MLNVVYCILCVLCLYVCICVLFTLHVIFFYAYFVRSDEIKLFNQIFFGVGRTCVPKIWVSAPNLGIDRCIVRSLSGISIRVGPIGHSIPIRISISK